MYPTIIFSDRDVVLVKINDHTLQIDNTPHFMAELALPHTNFYKISYYKFIPDNKNGDILKEYIRYTSEEDKETILSAFDALWGNRNSHIN